MKRVLVAGTAGFCFGVDRAVSMCGDLLDAGVPVATLGEIIHNRTVVDELSAKGAVVVDRVADTPGGATLIVRSHGVPQAVYDECARLGITVADATCPYVTKIHEIVREYGDKGYDVLIAGDANHPEVQGIVGHCTGTVYVFDDLQSLAAALDRAGHNPCILVAQTTFNLAKYTECAEAAKKACTNILIFDTICNATRARQQEAGQLALASDVCIVIGGQNSSNTGKLYEVCASHVPTYRIQHAGELSADMFKDAQTIGVTAGASTPARLIEEVLHKMDEFIKGEEIVVEDNMEEQQQQEETVPAADVQDDDVSDDDFNFEQALEDSLRMVHRGQRVEGIVTSIHPNEVVVDIGTKQTGFIPLDELSDDASLKPEEVVQVGDKVNLIVTKVQDMEGFVTLSKKRVDSEKGLEELAKGVEEGTVFDAYITEVVNKGLVAVVKGVRVFIPGSQATLRRGEPYEQLARTHQKIKILEVTPQRRRAIGSIRAVLDVENEKKREEFWQNVEVGKRYTGTVKSLTAYGAFVDLGGVDGMIHKSELSWNRVAKPSDVVSVGDEVEVYVKEFDPETKRISLGYRDEADNPWNKIQEYSIGDEFEAPVVSVTTFGAFVRVLPGVDGLVHLSEMSTEHVKNPGEIVKVGDTVKVRLIGIDAERKRISLSMKPKDGDTTPLPLLDDGQPQEAEEEPVVETVTEEAVVETPVEEPTADEPATQDEPAADEPIAKEETPTAEEPDAEPEAAEEPKADDAAAEDAEE